MKKSLALISFLFLLSTVLYAASPVGVVPGLPESRYDYTNSTVSVSSHTLATFPAVNGYRAVTLAASTSFYYVADGTSSVSTIRTNGFPVLANTNETIESNQMIGVLLPPGVSATTLRYIEKRK